MKKLIVASNNQNKIKEIKDMLKDFDLNIRSLKEENIKIDVLEDGKTFEENAKKKAYEIYKYLIERGDKEFLVLSDDSGLSVDYLKGEPGIFSARYAGEHGNDLKNNIKLLNNLEGVPLKKRGAQFICNIALYTDKGEYYTASGSVRGYITDKIMFQGGFGYDPIFFYKPFEKTFGEVSEEKKNTVSHRFNALHNIKNIINGILKK
ncbi:RdgB/HAM1 family non-canonical purine NTP pyrophosphatase [Clostridium sp. BJN0001]|uniref:RdgB/HAM1 family non-canonical purine NTP pyrophosphatase n=1 Tax=Clostridium sp. BJN0001 TaxID=2930219 RepID=UPI001FD08F83|nr:RdgB/HAM1 family non-canonical purine NTP pyrophosphatase [Clostridium sp. BJN0001]